MSGVCVCVCVCVSVCLSVCPRHKTKTVESTITKFGTEIVHYDTSPTNEYSSNWKKKHIKGDRTNMDEITIIQLATAIVYRDCWLPVQYYRRSKCQRSRSQGHKLQKAIEWPAWVMHSTECTASSFYFIWFNLMPSCTATLYSNTQRRRSQWLRMMLCKL